MDTEHYFYPLEQYLPIYPLSTAAKQSTCILQTSLVSPLSFKLPVATPHNTLSEIEFIILYINALVFLDGHVWRCLWLNTILTLKSWSLSLLWNFNEEFHVWYRHSRRQSFRTKLLSSSSFLKITSYKQCYNSLKCYFTTFIHILVFMFTLWGRKPWNTLQFIVTLFKKGISSFHYRASGHKIYLSETLQTNERSILTDVTKT